MCLILRSYPVPCYLGHVSNIYIHKILIPLPLLHIYRTHIYLRTKVIPTEAVVLEMVHQRLKMPPSGWIEQVELLCPNSMYPNIHIYTLFFRVFSIIGYYKILKKKKKRNSLAVQWLGLGAFTAVARVQSLVRELRSCKLGTV